MNDKMYFAALDEKIDSLEKLRSKGVKIATGIVGKTLTTDDLFFCASLNRCLQLIDGVVLMLKERNLTCAGPLLRLQMDNCMRTYAAFIAEDRTKVIECILDGTPIKKQRDTAGKPMTDCYLKTAINQYDSVFAQVYNQASGFVHLSEKAFYQIVVRVDDKTIDCQVGHDLPETGNGPLLECADAFCHFVELHYKMLVAVADSKTRLDQERQKKR